ncbi:hypothetical protein NDU88_004581 [Pleurodeles waltl]|uniref:Uncharacterized protein n=1 Tax=Pleurodeles waltl TaxID=8319 RepID=A0AAV7L748_PLEWA|nr:hypothetical protein NDU88_004581 [Pleurodeles waltl]
MRLSGCLEAERERPYLRAAGRAALVAGGQPGAAYSLAYDSPGLREDKAGLPAEGGNQIQASAHFQIITTHVTPPKVKKDLWPHFASDEPAAKPLERRRHHFRPSCGNTIAVLRPSDTPVGMHEPLLSQNNPSFPDRWPKSREGEELDLAALSLNKPYCPWSRMKRHLIVSPLPLFPPGVEIS